VKKSGRRCGNGGVCEYAVLPRQAQLALASMTSRGRRVSKELLFGRGRFALYGVLLVFASS